MLRGIDLIVLLYLCRSKQAGTVRSIGADLGLPSATVQRSLDRLDRLPVFDRARGRVNGSAVEELCVHALPYMFPPERGGETRGVAAAWAASPLAEHFARADALPPVWPSPRGSVRGWALEPLHPAAARIAAADPDLGELLVLVDGVRAGDARVRKVAASLVKERLRGALKSR